VNLPPVGEPADLPADLSAEGMEAWREVQAKTNHKV